MENFNKSHTSMLREAQLRELERRELQELDELRSEIAEGDLDPGKMDRALELAKKYFGLVEE